MKRGEVGTYKIAAVCTNGHVSSDDVEAHPPTPRCKLCGEVVRTTCANCESSIHGRFEAPGVFALSPTYRPPAYCHQCGSPYPWTSAKLDALRILVKEEGDTQEVERVLEFLNDLVVETPRTDLAFARFKKWTEKVSPTLAKSAWSIVRDLATEAVKKHLRL